MEVSGSPSSGSSDLRFGKRWAIVREWDRINRQSQAAIPLDARVYKLFTAASVFLFEDGKDEVQAVRVLTGDKTVDEIDPVDHYRSWLKLFLEIEREEPSSRAHMRRQRWEQIMLLQRLFDREGVFVEEGVPSAKIAFQEYEQT